MLILRIESISEDSLIRLSGVHVSQPRTLISSSTSSAKVEPVADFNLEEELRRRAARVVGTAADSQVLKLFGQASDRVYYRISDSDSSVVAMVMPKGGKVSEEVSSGEMPDELPFLNVQRYLASLEIRVPEIFEYDEEAGILLLEDLGDRTFESALDHTLDSESNLELYAKAVDLLALLRLRSEQKPDQDCIAFGRAFEKELFRWELEHFHEWGLVARQGRDVSSDERKLLDRQYGAIATELATLPVGFSHRDFQSRNLMLKNDELVVIDFQDALLAPIQYDLVALLRDSYVELPWSMVESLVWRFCDTYEALGGHIGDRLEFMRNFDLLTVQRKLKDGGRFVFIDRVKNNPSFLPSIPASFRYVKQAINRLPELKALGEVLERHVPEMRAESA